MTAFVGPKRLGNADRSDPQPDRSAQPAASAPDANASRDAGSNDPYSRDAALVAEIRKGDDAAFDEAFRRHVTSLIGQAARVVRSDAVAQDIVMDVFTRLWRDRLSLPADTRLGAYLKVAVRNSCIDYLRHDRVEASVQEMSAGSGWIPGMSAEPLPPDEELERSEAKEIVRRAFTTLPQRMRQVLELRWLGDKSYKEISRELGIPVKSVENYLGRAMRQLRERMRHGS
jgi:RNA polymerase sigma-70 factor (ECF subfamily)